MNSLGRLTPVFIFDMTGVVFAKLRRNIIVYTISKNCGVPYFRVYKAARVILPQLELNKITFREYLAKVMLHFKCELSPEFDTNSLLQQFLKESTNPRPEIVELIRHIRKKGYEVYALTNSFTDQTNYVQSKPWSSIFNKILSSSELGLRKPDSRLFNEALRLTNCAGKDVVFIDDNKKNLEGASKAGIRKTIMYHDPESLKDALLSELPSA